MLAGLAPRPALALEPSECATAFEQAQRLRKSGQLLEAGEKFRVCGGPACPDVMHAECLQRLDEVERSTPSLVLRTSPDVEQARAALDDDVSRPIDGVAIAVDPGPHSVTVEARGYRTLSKRFIVSEGEKLKVVELDLVRLAPDALSTPGPAGQASSSTKLWWPLMLASGVALTGAGVGVGFGVAARGNERALDDCAPRCSKSRVEHVKDQYLLANVSFGVGAAGLVAAAVLLIFPPSSKRASSAQAAATVAHSLRLHADGPGTFTISF